MTRILFGANRFARIFSAVIVFALFLCAQCENAFGHATDETYIWLNPQANKLDGHVEFRLNDLRRFMKLDVPEDYAAAKVFILEKSPELEAYVKAHFKLETVDGQPLEYEIIRTDLLENDFFGHFAQFYFETKEMEEVPSKLSLIHI